MKTAVKWTVAIILGALIVEAIIALVKLLAILVVLALIVGGVVFGVRWIQRQGQGARIKALEAELQAAKEKAA